jgi:hypothetical protein
MELIAAIAPARSKNITGEAFGVDSHEDIFPTVIRGITDDEGYVLESINGVSITYGGKTAIRRRKCGFYDALNKLFRVPSVSDELVDGDHRERMFIGKPT